MKLMIDGQTIEAEAGATLLQAARQAGIEIPTLCHLEGLPPQTSCFLCVVQIEGRENLAPACATPAAEGLIVSTRSEAVTTARKTALELLLSDHEGCCVAPCAIACPADLDIPGFIGELTAGNAAEALKLIKQTLPFPTTLGRICPAFCESGCKNRRGEAPTSIKLLHRFAGDADLAGAESYLPECKPATGKRVAIVGAGAAGLSAAFYLLQEGHACEVFEAESQAGGRMRRELLQEHFDASELDGEIAIIARLGAQIRVGWRLGIEGMLQSLRRDYDAVLLAIGSADLEVVKSWGLEVTQKGIAVDRKTPATAIEGVFAAGECATGFGQAVHAVGAGRLAARAIDQYVRGAAITSTIRPFIIQRRLEPQELRNLSAGVEARATSPLDVSCGITAEQASEEAARCLQCGCGCADGCRLRGYAAQYGAQAGRFRGERREAERDLSHPDLVFEPGKCILCGLCVRIAEDEGEPLGLAFVGRGFPTRVAVPLAGNLAKGIQKSAHRCAAACPTGAISLKKI